MDQSVLVAPHHPGFADLNIVSLEHALSKNRLVHLALVPALINNQIDLVFAAGDLMKDMYEALPSDMRGAYDATASGLAPKAVAQLKHLDIVLVKGSNGSRMREVVQAIDAAASEEE